MGCTCGNSKETERVFLTRLISYVDKSVNNKKEVCKNSFIFKNTCSFNTQYIMKDKIGEGSYGRIFKVKHIPSGETRCCKVIKCIPEKESKFDSRRTSIAKRFVQIDMQDESIPMEIKILSIIDHPNIIKIYEYFISNGSVYIVLEYVSGVNLRKHLTKEKFLPPQTVFKILSQVFYALTYLSSMKLVHRDIKPENIMITHSLTGDPHIKIIDFGSACFLPINQYLTKRTGSLCYTAPEVLKEKYTLNCDVWSTGIMTLVLLYGSFPTLLQNGQAEKNLLKITSGKELIEKLPTTFYLDDIIKNCLILNFTERPLASAIYKQYFSNKMSSILEITDDLLLYSKILSKLIIKSVFHLVVNQSTITRNKEDTVHKLNDGFRSADLDGSGIAHIGSMKLRYTDYIELMMFDEIRKHLKKNSKKTSCYYHFFDLQTKQYYTIEELLSTCKIDYSGCLYSLDVYDINAKFSKDDHLAYVFDQLSLY